MEQDELMLMTLTNINSYIYHGEEVHDFIIRST